MNTEDTTEPAIQGITGFNKKRITASISPRPNIGVEAHY